MIIRKKKVQWVRVINPTDQELEALQKEYSFHPLIIEELKGPSARARVEKHPNYIYAVYHLPIYNNKESISVRGEVDFLVTKTSVITVEYQHMEPFDRIEAHAEQDAQYHNALLGTTTAHLFHSLMESLLAFQLHQLGSMNERLEDIDATLFGKQQKLLTAKLSYTKRDLLNYYIITRSQEHIFSSLIGIGESMFGKSSSVYWNDLEGNYIKILRVAQNYTEAITAFEETAAQLLRVQTLKYLKLLVGVGVIAVIGLVTILAHMLL